MSKKIGMKIKLKRISLDIKQAELAKLAGVSQNYISLIERNERKSPETVKKIIDVLKHVEAMNKVKFTKDLCEIGLSKI